MAYNIKWFDDLVNDDNSLKTKPEEKQRLDAIVDYIVAHSAVERKAIITRLESQEVSTPELLLFDSLVVEAQVLVDMQL